MLTNTKRTVQTSRSQRWVIFSAHFTVQGSQGRSNDQSLHGGRFRIKNLEKIAQAVNFAAQR